MALHINKEMLAKELLEKFEKELKIAGKEWESDAYKYFRGIKYTYSKKKLKAKVDTHIEILANQVIAHFKANTIALADSYGTGSLMLDNNPGLAEYKADKKRWNPERTGKAIVGRKKGKYEDIFGQIHTTSGKFKGQKLENRGYVTYTSYYISPNYPSRAIQIADQWFYKKYLPKAYERVAAKIDIAKCLVEK